MTFQKCIITGQDDAGKGTDGKLLLQDKLKATAADTQSHIPKI